MENRSNPFGLRAHMALNMNNLILGIKLKSGTYMICSTRCMFFTQIAKIVRCDNSHLHFYAIFYGFLMILHDGEWRGTG